MAMKAVECTADGRKEPIARPVHRPAEADRKPSPGVAGSTQVDNMDELVMMLVPKVTFNAMEELAKKHGGSVAQVMSVALKLLQLKSEEAENGS